MSDARWALIKAARVHDLREIVNAILHVNRTGIPWEYLPHDFPPYKTVYDYYAKWEADGTTQQVHDLLRDKTRRFHGRPAEPTAAVVDGQSVKTSANVAESSQGIDLGDLAAAHPSVSKVWADGGYQNSIFNHGAAALGIDVEVVQKPRTKGFSRRRGRRRVPRVGPGPSRPPGGGLILLRVGEGWSRGSPHPFRGGAPSADYSPGSNPHPPSPPVVRVTSPSRPTKAVVLTGSLGTEADVTRREIGR
ncbi:transposase [Streptomyces rishiriensis]|uniref:transposase n=1 Tax=Streptomyces rishiriensis TaxID=68264 RepID=UPI0027D91D18|nr:transposase [Streptomyces rishiriensis]